MDKIIDLARELGYEGQELRIQMPVLPSYHILMKNGSDG